MAESSSESSESCEYSDEGLDSKVESTAEAGSEHKAAKEEPKKGGRTIHGAVAIIVYEGPDGTVEFYLEENPQSYSIPSARGKLRFVGGTIETTDKGGLEALVRELTEEVEGKEAQKILISILLNNKKVYTTIEEEVDGKQAKTYIYTIKITSPKEWNTIKNSSLTHDAGYRRILSLQETLQKGNEYFAFKSGEVLKQYINDNYKNIISKRHAPKPYASLDVLASAYSFSANGMSRSPIGFVIY